MSDHPLLLLLLGVVVGIFIGLTGLGGGAVVVPLLVLLCGMDQKSAQGTSLSIILSPLQAPAIYNYATAGFVKWNFLLWMAPGVLIGSFIGSYFAKFLDQNVLKTLFGLLLVYVGSYMLMSLASTNLKKVVAISLIMTALAGVAMVVAKKLAPTVPPDRSGGQEPGAAVDG